MSQWLLLVGGIIVAICAIWRVILPVLDRMEIAVGRIEAAIGSLSELTEMLGEKADMSAEISARIETAGIDAAKAAANVASDLLDARMRADKAQGPHGAAADAFGQSGK